MKEHLCTISCFPVLVNIKVTIRVIFKFIIKVTTIIIITRAQLDCDWETILESFGQNLIYGPYGFC